MFLSASRLAFLLATGLLAGCKKDVPTGPIVVTPPVGSTSSTPTPPQYGTPFAGVPDRQDAVIYQVNIRAFSSTGNAGGRNGAA